MAIHRLTRRFCRSCSILRSTEQSPAYVASQFAHSRPQSCSRRLFQSCTRSSATFQSEKGSATDEATIQSRTRVVPSSPSYFTGLSTCTDDLLLVEAAYRKYHILPQVTSAPRIAWKSLSDYKTLIGEPVREGQYSEILRALKVLSRIQPMLMPEEVVNLVNKFKKDVQPNLDLRNEQVVDEYGRAKGVGRRKASTVIAWLVEGEGEVLINGRSLSEYFGRIRHRDSAVFAMKATGRVDKYNVWALAKGGGLTGQAEAMTLAVAKALMVHEPLLKPALRRGECVLIIGYPTCMLLCSVEP